MEDLHGSVLRRQRMYIAKNVNVNNISQELYTDGILDEDDLEEIKAENTNRKKALFLLDLLPKKGPRAFKVFCQALHSCNYSFVAKRIQAALTGECSEDADDRNPRSFGLFSQVPNFVGRTALCREIKGLLTNRGGPKLATLVSPPGFGKTAVAKTVGHMIKADCRNDVLFFSLKNKSTLTTVAKEMLEAVELPEGEEPIKQVITHFTFLGKDTVLIMDSTEDLQWGDNAQFEEFLEHIGHAQCVSTMTTSRLPISKLELFPFLTKHISLEPLNRMYSAYFLRDHVPGISEHWESCFAKVCGGVPRVLQITASVLNKGTVEPLELHKKLQKCLHGFLGLRHPLIIQYLYCPLKVSFNQLPPALRSTLQSLAVFPTTFTAKECLTLFPTHDALDIQLLMGQLVQHSLLQKDQHTGWYSIHPLVKAFCKFSRDEPCASFNTALRLFTQHYLTMLLEVSGDFISTDCKLAINKYNNNKTNIHHALLSSTEDMNLMYFGLRVSTETVNFLAKVLNLDEYMSVYSCLQKVASVLTDKTCYSECLVSIGFKRLCYDGFQFAYEAKEILCKAFELQTHLSISDTECHGHCMSKLGLLLVASGDDKKGTSLIARAIAVRKQRVRSVNSGKNERMLLAGSFCDLGMALSTLGHYKAAVNIWTNISLVKYQELLGNHPFTASLLGYIGSVHQKLRNSRRAVSFNEQCLSMRRMVLGEDHPDTARAYYRLGCSLGALGDTTKALEMLNKGFKIQLCVHSSKHDIERSWQEINSIQGNKGRDPPYTMLQSMCLGN